MDFLKTFSMEDFRKGKTDLLIEKMSCVISPGPTFYQSLKTTRKSAKKQPRYFGAYVHLVHF